MLCRNGWKSAEKEEIVSLLPHSHTKRTKNQAKATTTTVRVDEGAKFKNNARNHHGGNLQEKLFCDRIKLLNEKFVKLTTIVGNVMKKISS